MTSRLQQYQINVNNDIQNKRNSSQLQAISHSSSQERRRITELESSLNSLQTRFSQLESDYSCSMTTIGILYNKIRQLREKEINEYYLMLDRIWIINKTFHRQLLEDCNPRKYVYSMDGLDDAYAKAKRYLDSVDGTF